MIPDGREIALGIAASPVLSLIVKATVVSAAALTAARCARRRRASVRHLMLAATFVVLLALLVVPAVVPARPVTMPLLAPVQNVVAASSVPRLDTAAAVPQSTGVGTGVAQRQPRTLPRLSTVLLVVWIGGAALVLMPMIWGLMRLRRVRRNGLPWRHGQLLAASIASGLRFGRSIQVLLDDAADGPMTCGVVRPAIILPRDARQWAVEDLRRAVVHEIEHVRRADWVTLCLARAVCAVYWFHPLVWMLWRQLRLEAERACDDAVLRSADPETYADQLVTLAERLLSNRTQSALAMANRDDLSARVSAVLDARQARGRAGSMWIAGAAIAAALAVAAIAPLRAVAVARSLPAAGSPAPVAVVPVLTGTSAAAELNVPLREEAPVPLPPPAPVASPAAIAPPEQRVETRPAEGAQLPRFEVASVKPNTSGRILPSLPRLAPGLVTITNIGLQQLINVSHDIQPFQLTGLPGWAETARYDITATSRESATPAELLLMVRALLVDRFQLVTRREARDADLYALEQVSPGSSKLRRSQADCGAVANMPVEQAVAASGPDPSGRQGGPGSTRCQILPMTGRGRVIATGARISNLTNILTNVVGRQVLDRTGLDGAFDVNLTWTPEPGMQRAPLGLPTPEPAQPGAPSIFTALQEQLGLRLVSGRGPVEMLVVERLEPPGPD